MSSPTDRNDSAPALADFAALNEEIAALVAARIPLEPQLSNLGREVGTKSRRLAVAIGRRLSAGENLAAAMDAECRSLPASYRAVIEAGVESGQPGSALESLADSASRLDDMRRISGAALVYPLVILIVACGLLAFVGTKIVPRFYWLDQYQFAPIRWLAQWPYTNLVVAGVIPAAAVLTVAVWWLRSSRLGWAGHSPIGRLAWLPGARRIQRWSEAASFADLMSLLVERGIPFQRALRLAGESTQDPRLHRAAMQLANQIERGESAQFIKSTSASEPITPDFPLLVRLALRYSDDRDLLLGGLRQAASAYHDRALRSAEWFAEYTPILLTAAIGGTITIGFTLFIIWPYAASLHELAGSQWR